MLVVLPLRLALRLALRVALWVALRVALRCVHVFFVFMCRDYGWLFLRLRQREGGELLLLFLVVALPFLLTSVCSFTYSDFQECTPQHGTAAVL